MLNLRPFLLASLLTASAFAGEYEGRHIGFNIGPGFSKNVLGGFYSWGRNQINLGTDLTLYTFEEGVLFAQPSISYNRYLTDNGIYLSLGFLTNYLADQDYEVWDPPVAPDTVGTYRTIDESDWQEPWLLVSVGKNFQWTRWGIHLDATVGTPFGKEFIDTRYYWIGGGVSYRFRLDHPKKPPAKAAKSPRR